MVRGELGLGMESGLRGGGIETRGGLRVRDEGLVYGFVGSISVGLVGIVFAMFRFSGFVLVSLFGMGLGIRGFGSFGSRCWPGS